MVSFNSYHARILYSIAAIASLLAFSGCDNPSDSSSNSSPFEGAWYFYKESDYPTELRTDITTDEVIEIKDGVITWFIRYAADSVCAESEAFSATDEGASISGGMLIFKYSNDTLYYKPWTKGIPPWPTLHHSNDC